jgi:hypothetical protein
MEYHGKLYGKIAGAYFDTSKTSEDWDAMENKIKDLERELNKEAYKISLFRGFTLWVIENNFSVFENADIFKENKEKILRMMGYSADMLHP